VLAWFRGQGPGYQTRMNAVLRAYVEARKRAGRWPEFSGAAVTRLLSAGASLRAAA
jgi:hypothetical protein